MTKPKRKRYNNVKYNNKWRGSKEVENWTKVDKIFGNVFQNNIYWVLRDKTTEIEIEIDEIKECINKINDELSDLSEEIIKVSKMATNNPTGTERKGTPNPNKGSRRFRCVGCVSKVFQCYLGGQGEGDTRYLDHMETVHKISRESAKAYMVDFMAGTVQNFDPKKARQYVSTQMGKTSSIITMIPPNTNISGSSTMSSLPATQPSQPSQLSQSLNLSG